MKTASCAAFVLVSLSWAAAPALAASVIVVGDHVLPAGATHQPIVLVGLARTSPWKRLARGAPSATALLAEWADLPLSWIELIRAHRPSDALALLPGFLRIR